MGAPGIALGMVLYNQCNFLPQAIESLLTQTRSDFRIVAVDDSSTDGTDAVMRRYAGQDSRITYIRNEQRLGMILNKRKAFQEARRGGAEYFAWVADHDCWHPEWLARLSNELAVRPSAVLAYPLTVAIDAAGSVLAKPSPRFETRGLGVADRARMTVDRLVGAGDLIYGLFRADALDRCGGFPWAGMPDRLLLLKLSILGEFVQIEEPLWQRRYFSHRVPDPLDADQSHLHTIARHKRTLFGERKPPLRASCPVIVQAISLLLAVSVTPRLGGWRYAWLGPLLAFQHLRRKWRFVVAELRFRGK